MSDTFHVKVEGPGLTLEREVPASIAHRISVLILTGSVTPERSEPAPGRVESEHPPVSAERGTPRGSTVMSLREFLNTRAAKRGPDKIVTMAMYMSDYEGMDTFTAKDLKSSFQRAAEPVPGNLSRDIAWTVRTGWIARKGGGDLYLTNSGRDAVESGFPRELLLRTGIDSGRTRRSRRSSIPGRRTSNEE